MHKKNADYNYRKSDEYEKTVIHEAIEKGNLEIIKLLLEIDDIDINFINKIHSSNPFISYEKTVLYTAVEYDKIDVVKLLLENKLIDPNIVCKYTYSYDKNKIERSY